MVAAHRTPFGYFTLSLTPGCPWPLTGGAEGIGDEARRALADRLVAEGITNLVETYDPEHYNSNATVAENLLFGTPIGPTFELDALADNLHVHRVLDQLGLTDDLVEAGRQVAATMTEMFAGLPPEHEFFEQFSFIGAHELPECASILTTAESGGIGALDQQQRDKLLSAPQPSQLRRPCSDRNETLRYRANR